MQKLLIIGGGFSAVALTCQLLKQPIPQHIYIIAPKATWFGGIAYRCAARNHRLNVVAGNMSLYPQHPHDFVNFLCEQAEFSATPREELLKSFVERRWYGAYLQQRVTQAQRSGASVGHSVEWIDGQVSSLQAHLTSVQITCSNGEQLEANRVVIATGNKPSEPPWANCLESPDLKHLPILVSNPWIAKFPHPVDQNLPVVLIGAGLTMVDTYLALRSQGIGNPVIALSRKGLAPLPHSFATLTDIGVNPHEFGEQFVRLKSLKQQLLLAARTLRTLAKQGISPEAFVAAIREHVQSIWRQWTIAEKQQFMRHLASRWNVIRHRVPGDIYATLQQDQQLRRLIYQQARLTSISGHAEALTVQLSHNNGSTSQIEASLVVNCTGPSRNGVTSVDAPLFAEIKRGRYQVDALGFGVAADPKSFAVLEHTGEPSKLVYVLGSLLRGALWETTAVPDIRVLAHQLADSLAAKPA
ncbi:Uncharacterized NAD(P)/FAD-binding protein YdhS [Pseudidiomarina planktonica]|uniref:Uncharacterized NAD(P)/FAD-binding protein YdhS n=1 Tax=Pseudidiomarina planktonica TaxID=1323738 RepID=A0A1Y6FX00_9GAMM|nr:FAD/NAD(P)-binding protein [Pseudidiomarina planktonica]RUO63823.1 hypothetical protein CWI77_08850 [Pseudidiomarina planktonica]SMQ80110.1 Uncharacterized NAD(P)/FAD-binding protein YdhS [Pseudidiomarina planktonica]